MPADLSVSPQAQWKCACPAWTTPRECYCLRYAPDDSSPYDECECACHETDDDESDWDAPLASPAPPRAPTEIDR